MADQVFIQVRFKEQTPYGELNDALYFTQAEYATKNQTEIDLIKQTRVDNYVNVIQNTPAAKEPTKQELLDAKAQLELQIVDLDAQIAVAK